MIDRETVAASLTGAWELFLDRPNALRHFDLSLAGFWRSFAAILLVLPSYALIAFAQRQSLLADPMAAGLFDDGRFFGSYALAIAVDWVAMPLILAALAKPFGVARTYPTWVIARNWGSAIIVLPFAAAALLSLAGLADGDLMGLLWLASLIIAIRYDFIVALRALGAGIPLAIGVAAISLGVGLVITAGADALFGL